MAINEEVMTIIRILNEEGFGVLAGDLMVEISQGRDQRELDEETLDTETADYDAREPIAPEDQLPAAMQILHRRLVAPAKALAEGERLLGELGQGKPVRIRFVDPVEGIDRLATARDDNPNFPLGRDDIGRSDVAEKLDELLAQIAAPGAIV
ncbi:hypothetical protein [Pontixanthobacter aquaemixtae]|uniref:Uncharacterized protein n=1 Tax=Pontixanthobacter aquaemixtae TaxID=1958940 RepID=A0A844ZUE5_9SPHN|nr:hypothetical protein [Pontixanthobacter aquaemixtae]MXO91505.1 hypothetical protein [Pontixanthobacter aquaemixtae]